MSADLIVLGAKGFSNLRMMLVGSVAQGVLAYAKRPVLLVRLGSETVRAAIIGIDGTRRSLRALQFFESLAVPDDAFLVLSRAVEPIQASYGDRDLISSAVDAIHEQLTRQAEQDLATARDVLMARDSNAENEILVGWPAEQLVNSAVQHRADLIVVGSSTPSQIRRYLVGGTAERVAKASATSVLVVR